MLIFGTYKPSNINDCSFLNELYNAVTFYNTFYKNCVFLSNLDIVLDNIQLQTFGYSFVFRDTIKKLTCFKEHTPRGIDHNIANILKPLIKSMNLKTIISDDHKMIMTNFHSTFSILIYTQGNFPKTILRFPVGSYFRKHH